MFEKKYYFLAGLPRAGNTVLSSILNQNSREQVSANSFVSRIFPYILDKADNMGFAIKSGMEFEFSVFKETPEQLLAKNFKNLTPLSEGNFGNSKIIL